MIAPIETRYRGIRFRSRTEARWAVFFDLVGLAYDYEAEGFGLDAGAYLPDFWLRDVRLFLEVKGQDPTDEERTKCAELAKRSGVECLIAIGPPEPRFQLLWFDREGEREGLYAIAQDVRQHLGFWLVREEDGNWIGPARGAELPKGPMLSGSLDEAYARAAAERFDTDAVKRQRFQPLPHNRRDEAA